MKCKRSIAVLIPTLLLIAGIVAGARVYRKIRARHPLRPTICDRTGKALLTDRRRHLLSTPVRHAECGGKFAAALLGHTVVKDGKRIGVCGAEHLIDRYGITGGTLLLTLDAEVQKPCEELMDRIVRIGDPEYAHVTVVDPDGALIAAAQRPVIFTGQ